MIILLLGDNAMNRKTRRYLQSKTPEATSIIPEMNYASIMSKALEGVVKEILNNVISSQDEEIIKSSVKKNDNALSFRFRIDRSDVVIPKIFREHADKNNIKLFDFILDRWFRNLVIHDDGFEVELLFDNVLWSKLYVPYSALVFVKNDAQKFNLTLFPYLPDGVE